MDAIEDFTVNGAKPSSAASQATAATTAGAANSQLEAQVSGPINQYLQQDAWRDIKVIEDKYGCSLDDNYRNMIIEDIRNQIDARILHYTNQYRSVGFDQPLDAVTQTIIDKTKTDIRGAMDMYISKLHENRGAQHES
ncbi:putative spore germination protein GerPC [compost metagenome]